MHGSAFGILSTAVAMVLRPPASKVLEGVRAVLARHTDASRLSEDELGQRVTLARQTMLDIRSRAGAVTWSMEQLREQCEIVLSPLLEWMAAHGSESYRQSSPLIKAREWAGVCQWILNGTRSRQHYAAVLENPDELAKVIAAVEAKSAR
eukprot:11573087-Alexandrium_andersonii.AAC.1